MALTPSSARKPRRDPSPGRAPTPSPPAAAQLRGYTSYTIASSHHISCHPTVRAGAAYDGVVRAMTEDRVTGEFLPLREPPAAAKADGGPSVKTPSQAGP